MLYVAGELLNFGQQGRGVNPLASLDASYPLAAVTDGYSDKVAAHSARTTPFGVSFDLAMLGSDGLDNGDFNTWSGGLLVGFATTATGGGTVVETTVGAEVVTGSAAKMNKGAAGVARVTKTFRVRSGQRIVWEVYLRIAGAGQAKVQVYNPQTKMYWSGSVWQTGQVFVASETVSTTYVQKTGTFTVESLAVCQNPIAYLEISVEDTGAGGGGDFAFADNLYVWPQWNALVCCGHNIDPGALPVILSSTNGFVGSDVELVLTPTQPAFHGVITASARRWVALAMVGPAQSSQSGPAFYGEIVVTYLETALTDPKMDGGGYQISYMADSTLGSAPGGRIIATRTTFQRRRAVKLVFGPKSTAAFREARDDIHGRAHGAVWPVVIVPIASEDIVIHGRIDDSWTVQRLFNSTLYDHDITIAENPFPRVVPSV